MEKKSHYYIWLSNLSHHPLIRGQNIRSRHFILSLIQSYARNFFVGFLEDLKTPNGHFEINWPLKANGFNIYETQGYDWYQWAKLYGEHEELVKEFVQNKAKYCMHLVTISQDSYQELKIVLDEILELMKIAQPHFLYLRYVFNFQLT